MNIYYDTRNQKWYSTVQGVSFGKSSVPLEHVVESPPNHYLSFNLRNHHQTIGPLIGIMTGRRRDNTIAGNGPLFKKLQSEILESGGLSVVFTPEDLTDNGLRGFIFNPTTNQWTRTCFPLPHLIYNRVPFRRVEKSHHFQRVISLCKKYDIPFMNSGFIDKYELYCLLKHHSFLKSYLPETIKVEDKFQLSSFINKHKSVYLKPSNSSQGRGIYRVKVLKDGLIELSDKENKNISSNLDDFFNKQHFLFNQKAYIAQKEVTPSKHEGYRYDFRILVHFNATTDRHEITGVGVRQAYLQELTTHIPSGGRLIPYEQVRSEQHDDFIKSIAEKIGHVLSKEKGMFGEFSIDAGLDENKNYVIYEVNAKPMSFDEEHIESQRIKNLTKLFLHYSGFKWEEEVDKIE